MKELVDLAVNTYLKSIYKEKFISKDILDKVDLCKNILLKHVQFAYISAEYNLYFAENGVYIKEGNVLAGKDITNHLKGSKKAIFLIVTLGANIDRQINLLQYKDLSSGYILDELSSILIDIKCDKIADKIRENKTISDRFSCGYGDYPLSLQTNICSLLNSEKIGVKLTNGGMFSPSKTISAVIGVKE